MLPLPEEQGVSREKYRVFGNGAACTSALPAIPLQVQLGPLSDLWLMPVAALGLLTSFLSWTSLWGQCPPSLHKYSQLMWRWHICLSSLWTLGLSWVIAASQLTLNMKNRFLQGIWGSEFFLPLIYFSLSKLRELQLFHWQEMLKDISQIICSDL